MRILFFAGILFSAIACGSPENSNIHKNNENNTPNKGNSAGSNIIEMDTMHMDTSLQESTDSRK